MAGDALINTVLPGAGLAAMGVRAFGSAAQDARQRGADVATQMGCGAAVAGVEILSEKLFDGLAGIYGKGGADELVEKVIQGMTESEGGRKVLNFLASAFGEGFEEFFSGIIDPALETIIDGAPVLSHYDENTRADVIQSMIVGGILGGLGGAAELASGTEADAAKQADNKRTQGPVPCVPRFPRRGACISGRKRIEYECEKASEQRSLRPCAIRRSFGSSCCWP